MTTEANTDDFYMPDPPVYKYRMSNRRCTSDRLGPCEVCGKYVPEVHLQVEMQEFVLGGDTKLTHYGCRSYFGHLKCLTTQQRNST